jgi:uncharacterized lipoprotein YajG
MKIIILGLAVLLAGCSISTPVKRNFPDAVPALQEQCPELATVEVTGKEVSITDMLKTIVKNYGSYYECANKVDGWNEWYSSQRKIFESVK